MECSQHLEDMFLPSHYAPPPPPPIKKYTWPNDQPVSPNCSPYHDAWILLDIHCFLPIWIFVCPSIEYCAYLDSHSCENSFFHCIYDSLDGIVFLNHSQNYTLWSVCNFYVSALFAGEDSVVLNLLDWSCSHTSLLGKVPHWLHRTVCQHPQYCSHHNIISWTSRSIKTWTVEGPFCIFRMLISVPCSTVISRWPLWPLLTESIRNRSIRSILHTIQGNLVRLFTFQCHGYFLLAEEKYSYGAWLLGHSVHYIPATVSRVNIKRA
jgi:hypothetical protein